MRVKAFGKAGSIGLCLGAWSAVYAQVPAAPNDTAPNTTLAPVSVEGTASNAGAVTPPLRPSVSDTAAAMDHVPGGALIDNGGISGQVQFRGLTGYRNQTRIDGLGVASGGPNWMDPPLHYAPAALVASLSVTRGIPSVADSVDSIGTRVEATTRKSRYGDGPTYAVHGTLDSTIRSVNNAHTVAGQLSTGNEHVRLGLTAVTDQGGDTRTPYGRIRASSYQRNQYGLDFGHRNAHGETTGFVRYQNTGNSGNPDLPLDVNFFHTWLGELKNVTTLGETRITSKFGFNHVEHEMTNDILRPAPDFSPLNADAPDPRFIRARSQGYTAKLAADHPLFGGTATAGFDGYWSQHDAFVGNPDLAPFRVDAFDSIRRDYYSVFGQWKGQITGPYSGELGARYTQVVMDAGSGGVAPGLPQPAQNIADTFAGAKRHKTNHNVDLVAKLARDFGQRWQLTGALARRTRSPYYLERYAYIPLQASAGAADGNNYVGDLDLDPEIAYEADLGVDFTGHRLTFSPEIYYHRFHDYITGIAYDDTPGVMDSDVERVSAVNGDPTPLQYANVDAEIYGADIAIAYRLTDAWRVDAGAGYTRGKRTDTHDDLYRISPASGRVALTYDRGAWRFQARERYVAQADHIARSHLDASVGDPRTGGYALTDISGTYRATQYLSLAVGIDNLFDKGYRDFLSGYNRVGDSDIPVGVRLPGAGRNAYASLSARF